nr:PIN domain-containing protein [Candidatus Freyarchaeota archaeon]
MNIKNPFLDTTMFIAAAFPKEKHHKEGKEIINAAEEGILGKPVITDYILDEIVTFVRKKKGTNASIEILDIILSSPNLTLTKVENKHFEAGIQIFKTYERLSFTDAITVATMRDLNTKTIYSFDSGFDGISGIIRLTTIEK